MTAVRDREHRRNVIIGIVLAVASLLVIVLVIWFVIGVIHGVGNVLGIGDSPGSAQDQSGGGPVTEPGVTQATDRPSASPPHISTTVSCDDHRYYAGDDGVDQIYAPGPALSDWSTANVTAKAVTRIRHDPALASLAAARFDRGYDGLDDQTRLFVRSCDDWQSSVDNTASLMRQTPTTVTVPEGSWMLALVRHTPGVPYVIRQQTTSADETAVVYTVNGTDFLFLPDEGFAPVTLDGKFPYVQTVAAYRKARSAASAGSGSSLGSASTGNSDSASKAHAGDSTGKGADVGRGSKPRVSTPPGGSETPAPVQHGSPPKGSGSGSGSGDGLNAGKPPKP